MRHEPVTLINKSTRVVIYEPGLDRQGTVAQHRSNTKWLVLSSLFIVFVYSPTAADSRIDPFPNLIHPSWAREDAALHSFIGG